MPQTPIERRALDRSPGRSTVDIAAQGQLYATLGNIGQKWYTLLKNNEARDQFSAARNRTLDDWSAYNESVREHPDAPDTELAEFDKHFADSQKQVDRMLTNAEAKRAYGEWFGPRRSAMADRAMEEAFNLHTKNEQQRFDHALTRMLNEPVSDLMTEESAAAELDTRLRDAERLWLEQAEKGYLDPVEAEFVEDHIIETQSEIVLDFGEAMLNRADDAEFDRQASAMPDSIKQFAKDNKVDLKQRWSERVKRAAADRKFQRSLGEQSQAETVYRAARQLSYGEGFALLNDSDLTPTARSLAQSRLTEYHRLRIRANQNEIARVLSSEKLDDITGFMVERLPDMDAEATEKSAYEKQLRNRMRIIADGSELISDQPYMRELEKRAIYITTEDETFDDFVAELNEATYGDDPRLDPKDSIRIEKVARTIYEKAQTDMIARAVKMVHDNILTPMSPLLVAANAAVFRGEEITADLFVELASAKEKQMLEKELAAATVEKIHAWFAKSENRNKDARTIDAETSAIYRAARDVRDAGVKALRVERAARERGISPGDPEYDMVKRVVELGYDNVSIDAYLDVSRKRQQFGKQPGVNRTAAPKPIRRGAVSGSFVIDPKRPGQPLVESTIDAQGNRVIQGVRMTNGALLPVDGEAKDNNGVIWIFKGVKADGTLDWEEK